MTCYKASQTLYDLPFEFTTCQIEGEAPFLLFGCFLKFLWHHFEISVSRTRALQKVVVEALQGLQPLASQVSTRFFCFFFPAQRLQLTVAMLIKGVR